MICFPNCKINIGLYITARRADGYHDLETVFFPVKLHDILEAVPARETELHLSGLPVSGKAGDNLVMKAWELLHKQYPEKVPPLDIYLHKIIPMGAGLGGGSADGAFLLQLINDLCSLGLSHADLVPLSLVLGSDCPFFLLNKPCFATGRGETMTPVDVDLSAYSLQIVYPHIHISTAEAFRNIRPQPAPVNLRDIARLPVPDWKDRIANDFEEYAFTRFPELAHIKAQLYEQGAVYASLSGSGSSVYGIFPKKKKAIVLSTIAFDSYYME